MKLKKFVFDLDSKVTIYVPSTNNVNVPVDNAEQVKKVIGELSEMFGGATASNALGGWVCGNGEVLLEKVTVVYSFCTSTQLDEKAEQIIGICERLKKEMSQEAVTLEINGQCKFV